MARKTAAQLDREIAQALARRRPRRPRRPHRHHAVMSASTTKPSDAWDVAMDAILEHDPKRAAQIAYDLQQQGSSRPSASFTQQLQAAPTSVQESFQEHLDALETKRLLAELRALPDYQGWTFDYVYPGYFSVYPGYFSYSRGPLSVFFVPDWEGKEETLTIQVQDSQGQVYSSDTHPLPHSKRTGEKLFQIVRPTLNKLAFNYDTELSKAVWKALR